jgi:outer membrane protein assembly factor BamB
MKIDDSSQPHDDIEVSDLDLPSRRMPEHKRYVDFLLHRRRPIATVLIALAAISLITLLIPLVLPTLTNHFTQQHTTPATPNNPQTPALLGSAHNIICISGETPDTFYGLDSKSGALSWRFTIKPAPTMLATPLMANNSLYLLVQWKNNMQILALDTGSGSLSWRSILPQASPSSLTISGNILYITAQNGMLYAINTTSGHLLWSKQFPLNPFIQTLNGIVYVYVNDMAPLTSLWALQSSHGTLLWQVQETTFSRIIANNSGVTLLQNEDRAVEALRTSDGRVLWSQPVYADVNTPIVAGAQAAYLDTNGGQLTALDISTGNILWHTQQKHVITGSLVLNDNTLYLASVDNSIYTFRVQDGKQVWQKDMHQIIDGDMTITGGRLYIHTNDGLEHALQSETGATLWTTFIGQPAAYQHISEPNTYAQNVQTTTRIVYITEQDGIVNALRFTNGQLLWTRQITHLPQTLGDNLFAVTTNGTVVLLNPDNGHFLWSFSPK